MSCSVFLGVLMTLEPSLESLGVSEPSLLPLGVIVERVEAGAEGES